MSKTIFIFDGHALIFRSYHGIPPLSTSSGIPTNATFGFINTLLNVLEGRDVERLAVAFDSGRPTFRNEFYPDYKANRPEPPEDLVAQVPYIREFLEAMRIRTVSIKGFEADDLIGTLSRAAKKEGYKVVIVGSDKDLFQLVDDDVSMYDPWKESDYDARAVKEKLGVYPNAVIDFLALVGDKTDNVPGMPRVGNKTAVTILEEFGSLDSLLRQASQPGSNNLLQRVAEYRDHIAISRRLVTIDRDVPIDLRPEDCDRITPDEDHLAILLKSLEFASLSSRLLSRGQTTKKDYIAVLEEAQFTELVSRLEESTEFSFDTETTSLDPIGARLIGISVALEPNTAYYIPLGHNYLGAPKQLDTQSVINRLKPLLESSEKRKIGQNIKYDSLVLRGYGIDVAGPMFDTMVADYLLRPTQRSHGLDAISFHYLGWKTTEYKELVPPRSDIKDLREVDVGTVTGYAAEDADMAFLLKQDLEPRLADTGLSDVFEKMEMPLVSVLANMERRGVRVDVEKLRSISREIEVELTDLAERIHHLAGEPFTIDSPKQLAVVLFEKLELPKGRKTKTGYSTDQKVLESLSKLHPLPAEVLRYRELAKIKSTYADSLPALVNARTGRIHTSFNQTVTATGRLSSSDPNLQNIPIRSPIGRRIRAAFIPEEGYVLASFDYSQIELRLLAHLSKDPELQRAFREGKDIHKRTAASVFNVSEEQVDADMRAHAKTINFGITYGMGPVKLAGDLNISKSKAKEYIDHYFSIYSGVKEMIEEATARAERDGFVTTMFGRRRDLPDITSQNRQRSEAARRAAFNTIIQGTAADIIKVVMVRLAPALAEAAFSAHMILQVHDELVFEVEEGKLDEAIGLIKPIMEETVTLDVPLPTSVAVGKNWEEAK